MLLILRFLCLAMGLSLVSPSLAQDIILEPGDEISVDVVRNPDLNRTVVVGAFGQIRLPYAGAVALEGLTLDQARDLIAAKLFEQIAVDPASVSLDIVARAPVYVINNGIGSGPIDYRPGITVLMAAASVIPAPSISSRISVIEELETSRKPFELEQTQERLALVRLRIARLTAEASQNDFEAPGWAELEISQSRWKELVRIERASLIARNELNQNQDKLLADQEAAQKVLISRLEEQRDILEQRKEILQKERDRTESLSNQGLARRSQMESIEGAVLDLDFTRVEVLTELGNAQSGLAAIQRTRGALQDNRSVIIAETLAELRSEEAQLISQVASFRRQISLSSGSLDALDTIHDQDSNAEYTLRIFRDGETLSAEPEDRLEPGDVILLGPIDP